MKSIKAAAKVILRAFLGSRLLSALRIRKLRKLQKKAIIKVAFQVNTLGKWKCDSLLHLMVQHPRFQPVIWVVESRATASMQAEERTRQQDSIAHLFRQKGITVVKHSNIRSFPKDEKPDIVFIHEPYDYIICDPVFRGWYRTLLCYVPYALLTVNTTNSYNGIGNNCALFCFYENIHTVGLASELASNRGRNAIVTGNPIYDSFIQASKSSISLWKPSQPGVKKVIWAPHWTIEEGLSWLNWGTFLEYADSMLDIAKSFSGKIQFAFKPHPNLYRVLCQHKDWGPDRTARYYKAWKELTNGQLEEGLYTGLFMQSDAMIHDCGSFLLEYLIANKPCMFLRKKECYSEYNEMGLRALSSHVIGKSISDIENFLQGIAHSDYDPMAQKREAVRKEFLIPPKGKSAAQNILDALLFSKSP